MKIVIGRQPCRLLQCCCDEIGAHACTVYLVLHVCPSLPDVGDPEWVTPVWACCGYRKRDAPDMTSTQRSSGKITRASKKLTLKLLSNLVSR